MCLYCIDDLWKIFRKHTVETLILNNDVLFLEKKIKELKKDLEEKNTIISKGQAEFMNKVHPENSEPKEYRDEEKIKEWIKEIKLKYLTDFKVPRIEEVDLKEFLKKILFNRL